VTVPDVRRTPTAPDPPEGHARQRILIVEDDARLAALLREYLDSNGFEVDIESHGDRAVERIRKDDPALVILDLMLPGASGFDVCRLARQTYTRGVLILTASKAEVDHAVGLEIGADDFVVKPVEPRILLARIRSLLRRTRNLPAAVAPGEIVVGALSVNRFAREARVGSCLLPLTAIEFDVLFLLARRAGEVVSRDELYHQVRGVPFDGIDRGMDVHVSRLRQKLQAGGMETSALKSVRSLGYLLVKR
jgi:two-component system, OmpR family, response regulator RstA